MQSIERTIDQDIGPAKPKGLQRKDESSPKLLKKTCEELIIGTLNSLLHARGDAERFDYKNNKNITKQINIVSIFVSRIIEIIKLINNQLNKNEPSG